MSKTILFIVFSILFSNPIMATESMISIESKFSAKETADRFESILAKKGLTLFARIDHQKNAAGVDLNLRETEVIIFGNPKVGTPLMHCSQHVAIDLPQKVLIWKGAKERVWVGYNDPEYIKKRHGLKGCDQVIKKISGVLKALSNAAASD